MSTKSFHSEDILNKSLLCADHMGDDISVHVALFVHLCTGKAVQVHLLVG